MWDPGITVFKVPPGDSNMQPRWRPSDLQECGSGFNKRANESLGVLLKCEFRLSRSGPASGAAVLISSQVMIPTAHALNGKDRERCPQFSQMLLKRRKGSLAKSHRHL